MDCRELTVFFSKSDMNLARRDELPAIQRSCFELFPDELRIGSLDNMTASARRREFSKYALFPSADYENRFEERCEWVLRFVGKADLVVFSGSDLSQNYLEVSYLRSLMKPGASSRFLSIVWMKWGGARLAVGYTNPRRPLCRLFLNGMTLFLLAE